MVQVLLDAFTIHNNHDFNPFPERNQTLTSEDIETCQEMLKGPPEELRAFLEEISPKKLSEETSKKRSMFELFLIRSKTSKLFEVQDDFVAVKIMTIFEPHVWKIDSSSEILQETLLHYFITRGFKASLVHLLCHNNPHMKKMVFERDLAQRSPLRIALVSFKEGDLQTKILERLWNLFSLY